MVIIIFIIQWCSHTRGGEGVGKRQENSRRNKYRGGVGDWDWESEDEEEAIED